MPSNVPLLTWDHRRQIAAQIEEAIQSQGVVAKLQRLSAGLSDNFALLSDKCFNVTSLLMAVTGRTSRFPMTVWDYLEGEFESEAGYALAQLPLQLHHLCMHCANADNAYDREFGSALSLIHRLDFSAGFPARWPEIPTERIDVLRAIVRVLPDTGLPRPFGVAESNAFRRCWFEPIDSWPYQKLNPPPESLLSSLIPEVLALGNLAFQFWTGLSHFTWGAIPAVFDGSEERVSAALNQQPADKQLVHLPNVYLKIAAYDLPATDTGHPFSERIDLIRKWEFSE